jgi:hypothetical protein
VRGFDKVRGEWSLMALCYNLARVLNIIGFDRLIAALARMAAMALFCGGPAAPLSRITVFLKRFCSQIAHNDASAEFASNSAP